METFESKLGRIGYKINSLKGDFSDITLAPTKGKILSGFIPILISIPLVALYAFPIMFLLSLITCDTNGYSPSLVSVGTLLGIFGMILFYKGSTRLFKYLNFMIQFNSLELIVHKRKDLMLEKRRIKGIDSFHCELTDEIIRLSCLLSNGDQVELINEKNCVEDCLPVLEELKNKFNFLIKRK